jgi:hypothetical protein
MHTSLSFCVDALVKHKLDWNNGEENDQPICRVNYP